MKWVASLVTAFVACVAMAATGVDVIAGQGRSAAPAVPDLEGTWNFSTLTPLERPAEFADRPTLTEAEAAAYLRDLTARNDRDRRDGGAAVDVGRGVEEGWFDRGSSLARVRGEIRTSLIIDPPNGRLPALTAEARERQAKAAAWAKAHPADGPEDRSLQERCLAFNAGPPLLPGPYNNFVQVLQFADHVVIAAEMIHDARLVPVARPPAGASATTPAERPRVSVARWLGEPRGRWEGATLVIESQHFNGINSLRGSDANLHLTERFTRVDRDTLLYEFTVDDPTAFTRPWTAVLPMTRATEPMFEYACHEGNHALVDILRGARYQERTAVAPR